MDGWSLFLLQQLSASHFYRKRRPVVPQTVVVPAHPVISDDEGSKEQDEDVADPTFIPPSHNLDNPGPSKKGPSVKRCVQPTMEALEAT